MHFVAVQYFPIWWYNHFWSNYNYFFYIYLIQKTKVIFNYVKLFGFTVELGLWQKTIKKLCRDDVFDGRSVWRFFLRSRVWQVSQISSFKTLTSRHVWQSLHAPIKVETFKRNYENYHLDESSKLLLFTSRVIH